MDTGKGGAFTTTVIPMPRLDDPEEELDILALVHRQAGVERVWMEPDSLSVVHDARQVSRGEIVAALTKRGFQVREA